MTSTNAKKVVFKDVNGNPIVPVTQEELPAQTGHSGEFLTTNGTAVSWSAVDSLPAQSGNSGKFLTTDGTDASWATINAGGLPTISSGTSGKFLTNDGSDASWGTVDALPSMTSQSGKYLTNNGSTANWNSITPAGIGAVSTSSLVEVKVVTSSDAKTSSSGWRVWSDGFIEQWGLYYLGSTLASTDKEITFTKSFSNTNYNVILTPLHSTANISPYAIYEKYVSRTASKCVIRVVSAIFGYSWYACGY